jgi:hypothetical protein
MYVYIYTYNDPSAITSKHVLEPDDGHIRLKHVVQ